MLDVNIRRALLGSCAVAALALGASSGALAQTQVNGGGSTLAGPTYQVLFPNYTTNIDPTTTILYANVGSGAGARSVLCNDGSQVPVGGVSPTTVHYGASDNPLTTVQINNWNNSKAVAAGGATCSDPGVNGTIGKAQGGPLMQIPSFGTPVTIAHNTPQQSANGALTFTDAQLCGIFSGKITSWSDPALTGIATRRPPTGNITVVYRSDGSGTSAIFTSHLNAVCTAANTATGVTFPVSGTQTFAQIFPGSTPPANFVGASGSGAVSAAIGLNAGSTGGTLTGTSGSIGYISPDYTAIASGQYQVYSKFLMVANVINAHTGAALLPSAANTATALATIPLPTNLTDGTQYVQTNADPNVGYPIAGYTTMIFPACYADNNVGTAVFNFLTALYTNNAFISNVQAAGFVNLPGPLVTDINNNLLNNFNNINPPIDIQDPAICQAAGASGAGTFPGR